jgi:inner membrane protein
MDTLTHALSGALLARLIAARPLLHASHALPAVLPTAPLGRFSAPWDGRAHAPALWQLVLVGTVAGAFPDIDAVAQAFGDVAYLRQHRGITHSVLMMPLWGLLAAWVMALCFASTRGVAGGWKSLYVVATAAIGIHIAGDWITQFGTMLLQPFSDARFGLGAMFIIDLTFTGILIAGLLLAAWRVHARWPAALGLGLACAWVGVAWVGQQEALEVGRQHARAIGAPQAEVTVMPRPASPFNWTVTVFDGQDFHLADVNTRRTEPLVAGPQDHFIRRFSAPYQPVAMAPWRTVPQFGGPDTPDWVRVAWAHPDFGFFRWFAQTPALIEAVEEPAGDGQLRRCAAFRDLRFEFPGRDESPFRYGLCLAGETAALFKLQGARRVPL